MIDRYQRKPYGLGGISIVLGDRQREVESIVGADALFKAQKLPMNAGVLAYRYFRECTLSPEDAMAQAIVATLMLTGIAAANVGAVIFASADARIVQDRHLLPRLLERCGLSVALPMTITSQECTSLLSAIDVAGRYVTDGTFNRVLVVSHDQAKNDTHRIQSFGVVGDATTACLVSVEDAMDFKVIGFAHRSDLSGMQGTDDFASRKALITRVTAEVLAQCAVAMAEVHKVFATNFFKPLAAFNAATLGLAEKQLHIGLAVEIGHCLCADPLINLADYHRQAPSGRNDHRYLLQAYAPGFLASMLIEPISEVPSTHHGNEVLETVEESW